MRVNLTVALAGTCVLGLFALAGCSPMIIAWRPPVRISQYEGDGAISRLSHPLNPGFKVDFEDFTLSQRYHAVYRVDGLPRRRHYDAYRAVVVVVLTPDEDASWPPMPGWVTSQPIGTVTLTLKDQAGAVLFSGSHEISSLRWKSFIDDLPYGRFSAPKGDATQSWQVRLDSMDLERQAPHTLEVDYVPGPGGPERLARVRIMAGGFA